MARQEIVMIAGGWTLSELVSGLQRLTGALASPEDDGFRIETSRLRIGAFPNDYIDEPGLLLKHYDFEVHISGQGREEFAGKVYELVAGAAAETLWMQDGARMVRHSAAAT